MWVCIAHDHPVATGNHRPPLSSQASVPNVARRRQPFSTAEDTRSHPSQAASPGSSPRSATCSFTTRASRPAMKPGGSSRAIFEAALTTASEIDNRDRTSVASKTSKAAEYAKIVLLFVYVAFARRERTAERQKVSAGIRSSSSSRSPVRTVRRPSQQKD